MPVGDPLSERELRVLEAVIQTYIQTAEPAGSQTISKRFGLGVSPATIRNTMSELEQKGYLFHPHTSAGRIPTDLAYRWYVDNLMRLAPPSHREQAMLQTELPSPRSAVEEILRRAAQGLGVLTQEPGLAVDPALDHMILGRLERVQVGAGRLPRPAGRSAEGGHPDEMAGRGKGLGKRPAQGADREERDGPGHRPPANQYQNSAGNRILHQRQRPRQTGDDDDGEPPGPGMSNVFFHRLVLAIIIRAKPS